MLTPRLIAICAVAVVTLILTLYLINVASLFVLPSCPIEQVVPDGSEQESGHHQNDELCTTQKGIISAGFEQTREFISPEAWTAWATIIMALFTGILSIVAYQQIALARSEFLTTNRPVLRVRYFKRTDGDDDRDFDVRFTVVNVGKSTANLLGSSVSIGYFRIDELPTPVYLGGEDVTGTRKFEVGASDEYIFRAPKLYGTRTSVPIIIYGYIVYSDERGNTRTTAFCRAWDFGIKRFRNIDDPDYEYED